MQCPSFDSQTDKTEEEYDQKIVWDLGCILINLLYGNTCVKGPVVNKRLKEKGFCGEMFPFSEKRKLSVELESILSRMCNVNV